MSELYDHDDICPGPPDCGHCLWCGEDYKGDHCPCEDCACCGAYRCTRCSIQSDYSEVDRDTGYRAVGDFCTVCRKWVDRT